MGFRDSHSSLHVERETRVRNRLGLHARTASDFARCATSFRSDIHLVVGERRYRARQAIEVLLAHLDPGRRFTIVADGPDAAAAAAALERLLEQFAALDQRDPAGIRPIGWAGATSMRINRRHADTASTQHRDAWALGYCCNAWGVWCFASTLRNCALERK